MCGRKNYRLQDIQLIKITGASAFGLRASSVARGAPMPHSAPSPAVVVVADVNRLQRTSRCHRGVTIGDFQRAWALGPQASPRGLNGLALIKVENTGLEPVTSWLQTRRSPS